MECHSDHERGGVCCPYQSKLGRILVSHDYSRSHSCVCSTRRGAHKRHLFEPALIWGVELR